MTSSKFPQHHKDAGSFTIRLRGEDSEAAELELYVLAYGVCRWLGARYTGLSEPRMFFHADGAVHIFSFEQCAALNALYAELEGANPARVWAVETLAVLKEAHDKIQEEHEQL